MLPSQKKTESEWAGVPQLQDAGQAQEFDLNRKWSTPANNATGAKQPSVRPREETGHRPVSTRGRDQKNRQVTALEPQEVYCRPSTRQRELASGPCSLAGATQQRRNTALGTQEVCSLTVRTQGGAGLRPVTTSERDKKKQNTALVPQEVFFAPVFPKTFGKTNEVRKDQCSSLPAQRASCYRYFRPKG